MPPHYSSMSAEVGTVRVALRSEITDEILSGYALHLKIPLVVAH